MTKAENTPKNGDRADEKISIIEKGRTSDVRVSLSEYNGRTYLDIRTHVVVDASGRRMPTRKGCTLPIGKIPELRAALEKAEAAAIDLGLLEDDNPEPIEAVAA